MCRGTGYWSADIWTMVFKTSNQQLNHYCRLSSPMMNHYWWLQPACLYDPIKPYEISIKPWLQVITPITHIFMVILLLSGRVEIRQGRGLLLSGAELVSWGPEAGTPWQRWWGKTCGKPAFWMEQHMRSSWSSWLSHEKTDCRHVWSHEPTARTMIYCLVYDFWLIHQSFGLLVVHWRNHCNHPSHGGDPWTALQVEFYDEDEMESMWAASAQRVIGRSWQWCSC